MHTYVYHESGGVYQFRFLRPGGTAELNRTKLSRIVLLSNPNIYHGVYIKTELSTGRQLYAHSRLTIQTLHLLSATGDVCECVCVRVYLLVFSGP